ncbi:MAG: ThiF family adenylyltransferase [Planctomycetota bacterium]|jgi:molybdopterin/thiamine biosynthesis adenylyltransferase
MAMITVEIWDASGSKKQEVQLPDDESVNRILVVLTDKMNLPRHSPDGQLMSYKFHHKRSGAQLLDNQTLNEAGVIEGDVLRLQPEITAGAASPDVSETKQDRFARFRLISWWDQERLASARFLVVGAGALGNEIVKNCALLGVGRVLLADMDRVEASNLSRSVLFREGDDGRPKAEAAAARAREIHPGLKIEPFVGDVVHALGLGAFRWADVVIGGLDNREARLTLNRSCARFGTPWIDGAIEALTGVARVFRPPSGPCYECSMSEEDWKMLEARRSCALLTRGEMEVGKALPSSAPSSARRR